MLDLFENPDKQPAKLRALLFAYVATDQNYASLLKLEIDLKKLGYSIEYGLDCIPYNLQKIQP
jgi:hypothetical protein